MSEGKAMNAMVAEPVHAREETGRYPHPYKVTPRAPHELKMPIVNEYDLLAVMKGYRILDGEPQLAADDKAGALQGYTGKLEIGIRRAMNESWWWWMGARRLAMILVPVTDCVRLDLCPCCRQPVKVVTL